MLAYSKRAHSEWSLLHKWEADVEKLSVQERKDLLAKMKVCRQQCIMQCMKYVCPSMLSSRNSNWRDPAKDSKNEIFAA